MAAEDYDWRLPYWLRNDPELRALWEEGVAEFGYTQAEDYVRSTDYYVEAFDGIRRDDGSYRFNEDEYLANMDSYRQSIAATGVDPSLFEGMFVELIKGDVSGNEFWQERVAPVYDRILDRGNDLVAQYSKDWGLEMTREALIASLLDPEMIGSKILNRQIGISEIRYSGGDYQEQMSTPHDTFDQLTERMYEQDITKDEAERFFGAARDLVPTMSALASRHADPDDDFDINEFASAALWNDPEQARRMRRLTAQESSLFSGIGGAGVVRSRAGGLAGLTNS